MIGSYNWRVRRRDSLRHGWIRPLLLWALALLSSLWRRMLIDFIKLSPNQLKNPGEQRASLSQYGHRNSWELELSNQWCPSLNQSLQLGWDALCARRVELQVGRGCPLREKPGLLSAGGRVPRGRERRPYSCFFCFRRRRACRGGPGSDGHFRGRDRFIEARRGRRRRCHRGGP